MILMMRCGGLPSFFTVAMSEALIVYKKKQQQKNKRTNGPVNAHLRSAVYTNDIENSPSIGADEALFFQNDQYTVHTSFFPSNDILTVYPFKYIGNPC